MSGCGEFATTGAWRKVFDPLWEDIPQANGCLEDLSIHSSSVISQLRLHLDSERDLCAALREAYEQQLIYHKECMEFSQNCKSLCSNVEDNQVKMQLQCNEMKNLVTLHRLMMDKMSSRMQAAVEERTIVQLEMEHAVLEREKVCTELYDFKTQNEQITLERTRLAAELASLMESLAESNQMRARNEQLDVKISIQDECIQLLEQALAEEKERSKQFLSENQKQKQEIQERICQLEEQRSFFRGELRKCKEQIDDLQTQLAASTKSKELTEEENYVCREQLIEMERELKSSLSLIRESKLQCEEQKDTIQRLQKDQETLQEELDTTKADAREMLLKMGKEISDSFLQVTQMKEKLLDVTGSLKEALREEDLAAANSVAHTPARFPSQTLTSSFVGSVLKAAQKEAESDNEEESDKLMSERSAFTKVRPTVPKAPEFDKSLPDILSEHGDIIANLSISASHLCQNKIQEVHKLRKELCDLQDKQWNLSSQYATSIRDLQEQIDNLKAEKENQFKTLSHKEQSMKQMQDIMQAQEEKFLQLVHERRDTENLYCEISQLKRSLQLLETERSVLQEELTKSEEMSRRDWIQKRILLQKEVTKLRLLYLETENTKSEIIMKTTRHREILEVNLCRSEKEVKKLDDLLERIRKALLSVPEVVASCQELKEVTDFLG
ncbi:sperm-associated antigen 5 [Rhinatrema bivittatum]|uniref:sperm-associated antigen 5 n=1 Tax=Rhinatrema bivittatum TaxID=194408 RepID=UPI00112A86A8|nr:sperm-associated antigen 5 [Rhinatrema bivittatum]